MGNILLTATTPSMSDLLDSAGDVISSVLGWVSNVCTKIVSEPFLLVTFGFLMLGGTIGIIGRMLSRN